MIGWLLLFGVAVGLSGLIGSSDASTSDDPISDCDDENAIDAQQDSQISLLLGSEDMEVDSDSTDADLACEEAVCVEYPRPISNEGILIGTDGSDTIIGSETDQTIYHNSKPIEKMFSAPHRVFVYDDHTDSSSDVLMGGAGNDMIFFGTGDQISTGDGQDIILGHLDIDSIDTEVVDFDYDSDKILFFIPKYVDLLSVENHSSEDGLRSIIIKTSNGDFTVNFPGVDSDLKVETIDEDFYPDQHPLLFANQHATLASNVFIIKSMFY